ncbi:lycopene cyclase domain-containing protein [Marinoscillum sp. MHG1-6]|uniref:lycopene cyclase domain-containing protein n=1 Tax=Marinoscillum sp. MHG1-6 TaxID=2959627 RepID=UPI0021584672|nr:lycopene cyclase domain-containing protein [Marinoscillum sp. MHG1-6]
MPDRFVYLALDLLAISVPLAFSFYPKAPFASTVKRIIPAILIPMALFVVWDVYFTRWGHWGFNERYLLGVDLLGLPLEEWLFFICIPYACLFTYFAFKHLMPVKVKDFHLVTAVLGLIVLIITILNFGRDYTVVTGILLGSYLIFLSFTRKHFLGQFFLSYLVILIPFFLINGVLTGSWIDGEVVWYNDLENLGMRLGTIPVEDPFYGMLLLLMNVHIWEALGSNSD